MARLPEPPKPESGPTATKAGEQPEEQPKLETVLVVDDEESIRSLVSRVLSKQGYEVLEAATPEEAIRISDEYPDPIPLAVSDVILPGMRGPEMVKQMRHTRRDLRVLYISGYTDDDALSAGVLEAGEGFLQKPFSLHSLTQTVRAVLDAPQN
jgi:DNA-binding response OmpR family regulator